MIVWVTGVVGDGRFDITLRDEKILKRGKTISHAFIVSLLINADVIQRRYMYSHLDAFKEIYRLFNLLANVHV